MLDAFFFCVGVLKRHKPTISEIQIAEHYESVCRPNASARRSVERSIGDRALQ